MNVVQRNYIRPPDTKVFDKTASRPARSESMPIPQVTGRCMHNDVDYPANSDTARRARATAPDCREYVMPPGNKRLLHGAHDTARAAGS